MADVPPDIDAADLYAEADYTALVRRPRGAVPDLHRLPGPPRPGPRLRRGRGPDAFDRTVAETDYPPAIEASTDRRGQAVVRRLERLDFRVRRSGGSAGTARPTRCAAASRARPAARHAPEAIRAPDGRLAEPDRRAGRHGRGPTAHSWRRSGTCGSASAAPPMWPGVVPRLLAGRLRHAQATPVPGGGRPRGRRLQLICRLVHPAGGQVPPDPAAPPTDRRAARSGGHALRRGHLRGPGRQPVRRSRRGPRLDLRARRRHRLVHDRPALHRRRQPARSRERPGRGMGQRLRPGLSGSRRTTTSPIIVDGGPTPFIEGDEVLVRIGLQARAVRERAREDASLTFVIDTSGSMARESRLELVKDALRILVDELGPDDRVAVVEFGQDARLVLPSTSARDTRPRSSARSTSSSPAAPPTSRPASGSATSRRARR